jgi:hypothetical protein
VKVVAKRAQAAGNVTCWQLLSEQCRAVLLDHTGERSLSGFAGDVFARDAFAVADAAVCELDHHDQVGGAGPAGERVSEAETKRELDEVCREPFNA